MKNLHDVTIPGFRECPCLTSHCVGTGRDRILRISISEPYDSLFLLLRISKQSAKGQETALIRNSPLYLKYKYMANKVLYLKIKYLYLYFRIQNTLLPYRLKLFRFFPRSVY